MIARMTPEQSWDILNKFHTIQGSHKHITNCFFTVNCLVAKEKIQTLYLTEQFQNSKVPIKNTFYKNDKAKQVNAYHVV